MSTPSPPPGSLTSAAAPELPRSVTAGRLRKAGAEMIGTFALVFAGCGAIMVDQLSAGAIGHTGVSLCFGLVIMVMVYATGHISGAHLNPAVTLAFAATRRFPWREAPLYIAAQVLAACAAGLLLRASLGPVAKLGATAPAAMLPSVWPALSMEITLTAMLMFVIMAVATDSRAVGQMAGWAIGGTVAVAALVGGPISGASLNPARSLGPALASGHLDALWLYLIGPVAGALVGAGLYQLLRCGGASETAKGCC
ncbi:MAG: hypothetical protein Tsb0020_53230 [Haliangiales bacterium]